MEVLVLNAGSSTQKSCLYNIPSSSLPEQALEPLWEGAIDWGRSDRVELTIEANDRQRKISLNTKSRSQALNHLLKTITQEETRVLDNLEEIDIIGHRVVHGGTEYSQPTPISPEVKAAIAKLIPLAPTHNPAHLEGIEAIAQILANIPQLAVFDTAFHSQIPLAAAAYPIPYDWLGKGIRRYGFHGISHQYCARRAAQILDRPLNTLKLITCHLGNGASLTAVDKGISINTTMGFTPLEGLMMGTRSGSIDPAIGIYLMREEGFTVDRLDRLLNRESGLKGIFGTSGDMREISEAMDKDSDRAKLAFAMYIHRLKMGIGAMATSLGGLDALVFAAGVGENSPRVRESACQGLGFLGVNLDREKNLAHPVDADIATTESKVRVLVVHTQEDWAIASECWRYLTHL
ncbi:acetate kinase [Spirulina sp. 06S082]|uniref:acetate kinase n=1 Tax=Spirulina sp. 06S082 TaxID=3110248 RepID=UPI002B1FB4C7|nr:acetate kinase [Spirulina sp. 06S082]MEA5469846.1 acetate kinase [Spirulina sp. 06S082]